MSFRGCQDRSPHWAARTPGICDLPPLEARSLQSTHVQGWLPLEARGDMSPGCPAPPGHRRPWLVAPPPTCPAPQPLLLWPRRLLRLGHMAPGDPCDHTGRPRPPRMGFPLQGLNSFPSARPLWPCKVTLAPVPGLGVTFWPATPRACPRLAAACPSCPCRQTACFSPCQERRGGRPARVPSGGPKGPRPFTLVETHTPQAPSTPALLSFLG